MNPNTGRLAKPTDPDDWSDFETAVKADRANGYDGVGFVFTEDDPYVGIDVDHLYPPADEPCTQESAEVFKKLWPWLRRFKTYAEFSQSGEGLHFICKAKLPRGAKNRYDLGQGIGVEIYTNRRYFVMTGDRLRRYPSERSVNEQQKNVDRPTEIDPRESASLTCLKI